MSAYEVSFTIGHVLRHAPAGSQGREAALIDIAQDLLLRRLHDDGLLGMLAFKGGTALRKLYAGAQGRFSVDLDFSVRDIGTDDASILELLTETITDLTIEPFTYGLTERRGKKTLTIETTLGSTGALASKLDVNPPPWLEPVSRSFVPMPIHDRYGGPLPELTVVRLEENVAEKIARLNRTTTARDVYDLVWLWRHYRDANGAPLDHALVRRLAVLKNWVDKFGLHTEGATWKPAHEAYPFDPAHWLRERAAGDFDQQDIGQLSVPPPDLEVLGQELRTGYAFLAELDEQEQAVAALDGGDRRTVLQMLAELPTSRLTGCW